MSKSNIFRHGWIQEPNSIIGTLSFSLLCLSLYWPHLSSCRWDSHVDSREGATVTSGLCHPSLFTLEERTHCLRPVYQYEEIGDWVCFSPVAILWPYFCCWGSSYYHRPCIDTMYTTEIGLMWDLLGCNPDICFLDPENNWKDER